MSKNGGPASFGFWKSILIGLLGIAIVICGLALFETSIIATVAIVLIGSMIVMIAAEAGKGKMRGFFVDPHTFAKDKPKSNLKKDLPYNPWDEVSRKK